MLNLLTDQMSLDVTELIPSWKTVLEKYTYITRSKKKINKYPTQHNF